MGIEPSITAVHETAPGFVTGLSDWEKAQLFLDDPQMYGEFEECAPTIIEGSINEPHRMSGLAPEEMAGLTIRSHP